MRALAAGELPEAIVYLWGERRQRAHAPAARGDARQPGPGRRRRRRDARRRPPSRRSSTPSTRRATASAAVLAAGNAPPARLDLREDLRTRLAWGLVYQLQPLSDADKAAPPARRGRAPGPAPARRGRSPTCSPPAARPRQPERGARRARPLLPGPPAPAHPAAGAGGASEITLRSAWRPRHKAVRDCEEAKLPRQASRGERMSDSRHAPQGRPGVAFAARSARPPGRPSRRPACACRSAPSRASTRPSRAAGWRPNTTASASPPTSGATRPASRRRSRMSWAYSFGARGDFGMSYSRPRLRVRAAGVASSAAAGSRRTGR